MEREREIEYHRTNPQTQQSLPVSQHVPVLFMNYHFLEVDKLDFCPCNQVSDSYPWTRGGLASRPWLTENHVILEPKGSFRATDTLSALWTQSLARPILKYLFLKHESKGTYICATPATCLTISSFTDLSSLFTQKSSHEDSELRRRTSGFRQVRECV